MNALSDETVKAAFNNHSLNVIRTAEALRSKLATEEWENACVLLMSSGNLGGLNIEALISEKTSN
jgi:hypothetical protein